MQLRSVTEITVFISEKKLYPVWISCRRNSYPILCEHSLKPRLKGVAFVGRRALYQVGAFIKFSFQQAVTFFWKNQKHYSIIPVNTDKI